jgi:subtilisin family serine protease
MRRTVPLPLASLLFGAAAADRSRLSRQRTRAGVQVARTVARRWRRTVPLRRHVCRRRPATAPVPVHLEHRHRSAQIRAELRDGQGQLIDGRGVSAAVIDTGVDGTHPLFRDATGSSAVKRNLKNICGPLTDLGLPLPLPNDSCFLDLTAVNDTDTLLAGGHDTHIAGIVAGRDTRLTTAPTCTARRPARR